MIPLSIPNISGNEWKYIKECLDSNWVSSAGSYVSKFEQSVADYVGVKYAIATSNGTAALHISLILNNVQPGDYVIVPNLTFVAPVNAIKYVGASPILVDIDPNTLQLDLDLLEHYLQKNTKVIDGVCIHKECHRIVKSVIPVHVLGNICNMNRLSSIALEYSISIIEDASEALGSLYSNKHAGTMGLLGCYSFNGNKIITTGGGGMIVTNDEQLAKRARHLTTQAKISPDEYLHDEVGYNYRMVNILAAMGVAQMENLDLFLNNKRLVAEGYQEALGELSQIRFPQNTEQVSPNNWLVTIMTDNKSRLLSFLLENGIQARPLWVPMNKLSIYKQNKYITENDNSSQAYNRGISLPSFSGILNEDLSYICDKISDFFHN